MAPRKAVFVDRDGVLIDEVNYLSHPRQLRLLPGSAEAVKRLRAAGFKVVVVSNQSGVARGYFTLARLREIHAALRALLGRKGTRLDGLLFCPHHPDGSVKRFARACACRKPAPGMLREAARRWKAAMKESFMVGDTEADVAAGRRAGCRTILVRTGHGSRKKVTTSPDAVAADLAAAADLILAGKVVYSPR